MDDREYLGLVRSLEVLGPIVDPRIGKTCYLMPELGKQSGEVLGVNGRRAYVRWSIPVRSTDDYNVESVTFVHKKEVLPLSWITIAE